MTSLLASRCIEVCRLIKLHPRLQTLDPVMTQMYWTQLNKARALAPQVLVGPERGLSPIAHV